MSLTWPKFFARFLRPLEIRGLGYQFRVPKLRVPPRAPAKQGDEDLKLVALTRKRHNERLSGLDSVALRFYQHLSGLRQYMIGGRGGRTDKVLPFSGNDLEAARDRHG